ncbi:hypothetical protein ON010_g10215 [Phytophthora cinnamomi]|nr:hypothetical protein ON010_g10215 [Phytophthora cinnamomi]
MPATPRTAAAYAPQGESNSVATSTSAPASVSLQPLTCRLLGEPAALCNANAWLHLLIFCVSLTVVRASVIWIVLAAIHLSVLAAVHLSAVSAAASVARHPHARWKGFSSYTLLTTPCT